MFSESYSFYLQKDYRKALDLLSMAPLRQQEQKTQDSLESSKFCYIFYWNNLACIHFKLGRFHVAGYYFAKALRHLSSFFNDINTSNNNNVSLENIYWLGDVFYNVGVTSLLLGKASLALKYLEECLRWPSHQRSPTVWLRVTEAMLSLYVQFRQRTIQEVKGTRNESSADVTRLTEEISSALNDVFAPPSTHITPLSVVTAPPTSISKKHNKFESDEEATKLPLLSTATTETSKLRVVPFRRLLSLCSERGHPHYGGKILFTSPYSLPSSLFRLSFPCQFASRINNSNGDNNNNKNSNSNNDDSSSNNRNEVSVSVESNVDENEDVVVRLLQCARRCLMNVLLLLDTSSAPTSTPNFVDPMAETQTPTEHSPPPNISDEKRMSLMQAAWTYSAWISMELSDPLNALFAATEALRHPLATPYYYYAHLYAAEAHCWLGNISMARAQLLTLADRLNNTTALSSVLSPDDSASLQCSLYVNLAVCHILNGEYSAARDVLAKSLEFNVHLASITLLQVYLELRHGRLERVLELLRKRPSLPNTVF